MVPGARGSREDDPRFALLAGFRRNLEHDRRLSLHTCDSYCRDIETLLEVTSGTSLESLRPHAIRRAVARLHGRGLSGRSLARMLSAWRGFFGWLARHRGFKINPCAGIRPPKGPKYLPKVLSPDATAQLLDAAPEGALETRDKAMFELLYSSGLRLAELAGLDIDAAGEMIAQAEVTVTGKGRKTRKIPVGSKAVEALSAWLSLRGQFARSGEQALFVSERGSRVSHRMVQSRLKRWVAKLAIDANVHPHVLRHSFASHVLQSSGDLRAVQEMLGHASISTTQVYTHLDFQHLAKAYDAAHPRAKKK